MVVKFKKKYPIAKSDMKNSLRSPRKPLKGRMVKEDQLNKTGKNQKFSIRDHNHKFLEIILEAKQLSSEDKVIEKLSEALEINNIKDGKRRKKFKNKSSIKKSS